MAAYGALISLFNTLETVKLHVFHGRLPISVNLREDIDYLSERVRFLIDFLESSSCSMGSTTTKVKRLTNRIRDAAYAAKDIIELNLAEQLVVAKPSNGEALKTVIKKIDSIKKNAMEIKERVNTVRGTTSSEVEKYQDQEFLQSSSKLGIPFRNLGMKSTPSSVSTTNSNMDKPIGFSDQFVRIRDLLMGQQTNLIIIPIVGMGGIGKTTLARNVYDNPSIVEHFYLRAWATVSQEYDGKRVLSTILYSVLRKREPNECFGDNEMSERNEDEIIKQEARESLECFIDRMSARSEHQLGEELYKRLCGMRFLIVIDDIWSIEAWDCMKCFFPDNRNESRIVITTRLSNVASHLSSTYIFPMSFLDEDQSWSLLKEQVFGKGNRCPDDLACIGKQIARICGGLPLSLVVVGGLLSKSRRTPESWWHVARNFKAVVSSENDGQCLKILSLSYSQLPIHLKPCFLYFSVLPEHQEIHVSKLIKLWVSEGFLKPSRNESLEEVAENYLNDLIGRNLILVHKRLSSQKLKTCKMHDLLRDLCLQEAREQEFRCATSKLSFDDVHRPPSTLSKYWTMSLLEGLNAVFGQDPYIIDGPFQGFLLQLVNSRYLEFVHGPKSLHFPSSVFLLWNIQTLIVRKKGGNPLVPCIAPSEIWEMPQLRHVKFDSLFLPDPSRCRVMGKDGCVLKNLLTLSRIKDFRCSEEVLKKIPCIKKLKILYSDFSNSETPNVGLYYSLDNLGQLHKLESLSCSFYGKRPERSDLLCWIAFPSTLKRLSLYGTNIPWADMSIVASLSKLEILKLRLGSFIGHEWNLNDDESIFVSLKFLLIEHCYDLIYWSANAGQFPCLVSLMLRSMHNLKEIPLDLSDIPTLEHIELEECSDSVVVSSMNIIEYQEDYGIEDLHVEVVLHPKTKLTLSTSKRFLVRRL